MTSTYAGRCSRAMDPWAAIDQTWSGTAYVSAGIPVIEPDWLLDDRDLRPFFAQPQRARDLLEAGGYGAAHSIAITVGDFGGRYLAHAQRIAMELEAVGFEPTVNVVNQRRFGEAVWLGGDYQMFVGPSAPVTSPNGLPSPRAPQSRGMEYHGPRRRRARRSDRGPGP